jgi:hypothetical protein
MAQHKRTGGHPKRISQCRQIKFKKNKREKMPQNIESKKEFHKTLNPKSMKNKTKLHKKTINK